MPYPPLTPGRIALTINAFFTSTACFVADWSPSHLLNPRWPPHAKFHNAQTMSLGLLLGLLTAYYTWRDTTTTTTAARGPDLAVGKQPPGKIAKNRHDRGKDRDSLRTAAIMGSLYYVAGVSAIFYPGTEGTDPEFGQGFPQFWIFAGMTAVAWVGYWLE